MKDEKTLEKIITENSVTQTHRSGYHEVAAEGAAKGGHIAYAHELLKQTSRRDDLLNTVALAGMRHGHYNEVANVFTRIKGLEKDNFLSHKLAMEAATLSGHENIFANLKKRPGDAEAIKIMGRGDLAMAARIIASSSAVGRSYQPFVKSMDGGNYFQSREALLHGLCFVERLDFVKELTRAAHTMQSNKDRDAYRAANMKAFNSMAAFDHSFFSEFKSIYEDAMHIRACMSRYGMNYDQARVLACGELDIPGIDFNQKPSVVTSERNMTVIELLKSTTFSDWSYKLVGAFISAKFGITQNDAEDMIEKFMTRIAKTFIEDKLKDYFENNAWHKSIFRRHDGRIESLRKAAVEKTDRAGLYGLYRMQYDMFHGTQPDPDPNAPKHEQPLTNTSVEDDFYDVVKDVVNSRFLLK